MKATIFDDGFIADLAADVNARLAELARRPIPSTKKLEQEIANEDRQLKRLTDRLDKADVTHLDAVIAKAEEMGRQLAAKRERLKDIQRAGRRPRVKSVRETDVVVALTHLRELLQGDVGVVAQVLKALVGDVIIEMRQAEGQEKPQMVARFSINAVPALAVLDRTACVASNDVPKDIGAVVCDVTQPAENQRAEKAKKGQTVVSLAYDRTEAARKAARNRDGAT